MPLQFLLRGRVILLIVVTGLLVIGGPDCGKTDADTGSGGTATPTTSPAASASLGHLSGMYIRQQSVPFFFNGRMTFNLQREFFYFFPDGHMLFGIPTGGEMKEHPTAADFAAFKDVDPKLSGTYEVKDGNITFQRGTAKSTEPFSIPNPADDSVLQIGVPSIVGSVKAMPLKDGQKLDGAYQYNGTIGQGTAITIFNVNTLNFHTDGTLGSDQLSGVDTKGIDTKVGNSGVTTSSQTATAGTYHLNGYTLETTVGGKATKATIFRWAGDDKASMICIDGRLYTHYELKK